MQTLTAGPLISVIMPMHNSEATVEEAIESLLNQSERDFELICVDDESTDRTRDIVASVMKRDGRVRLIALAKSDAGHARNVGLAVAAGRYLMFLDSDDLFDRDMLRGLSGALLKSDADIAICEADTFYGSLSHKKPKIRFSKHFREGTYDSSELGDFLFRGFSTVVWNKMFVREFVACGDLSFQEQPAINDASFVLCALASARSIALVPRTYLFYRVGSGTSIQDGRMAYPFAEISAAEEAYRYISTKCKLSDSGLKGLCNALFRRSLVSLYLSIASKELFRETYDRLRADVAEWGLERVSHGFPNLGWELRYVAFMRCEPDLLYWALKNRTDRRSQPVLVKMCLAARLIAAIALSSVLRGGERNE